MNNDKKYLSDLVKRLRDSAIQARAIDRSFLLHEAADIIEKLLLKKKNK